MRHLRNLIWLLFHPGAWELYRQTRDYRQQLHDEIMNHIKNFGLPLYKHFQKAEHKAKFAKDWNEDLLEKMALKNDKFLDLSKGCLSIIEDIAKKKE